MRISWDEKRYSLELGSRISGLWYGCQQGFSSSSKLMEQHMERMWRIKCRASPEPARAHEEEDRRPVIVPRAIAAGTNSAGTHPKLSARNTFQIDVTPKGFGKFSGKVVN